MIEYDAKQEINYLIEQINSWNEEYYQNNEPSVSDDFYDKKMKRLEELEKEWPSLVVDDSPTQKPGSDIAKGFKKVLHKYPMLSIQNAMNLKELGKWLTTIEPGRVLLGEPKVDGLALSIIYRNGALYKAVTRGNGTEGDDVTANAKMICNLPLIIKCQEEIEFRGEVYMKFSDFERYKHEYKNPRNLASGTLKLHDPMEVAERNLYIAIYETIYHDEKLGSDFESLRRQDLFDEGIPFIEHEELERNDVEDHCELFHATRCDFGYPIDGVVIKVDHSGLRKQMGKVGKYHNWQIAFKFPQEAVRSTLLSIDNQVGRTGVITPVANIKPIEILGTTVKRATLHNYGQIMKLDIRFGDTVFLEKGGEIIPKIVGVEKKNRQSAIHVLPPHTCPSCEGDLVNDGAEIFCRNIKCPAQVQGNLEHFVSKKCMNIIGLGPAALKDMLKYNIIQDFSDLYDIDRQNMYRHFGAVTANNILNSIEDSRNTDLWRVIHALGIPLIGERASKTLADYYQSMDLLLEEIYDLEESEIEGFGPAMTDSLIVWFIKNNQIVDSLMENGLRPVYVNKMNDSEHAGKSVVITGKLSRGRDEIKEKMEAMGISIKSSVSANTDFLLLGENPGSKFDKAKKFGIRIVDENFFFGG